MTLCSSSRNHQTFRNAQRMTPGARTPDRAALHTLQFPWIPRCRTWQSRAPGEERAPYLQKLPYWTKDTAWSQQWPLRHRILMLNR